MPKEHQILALVFDEYEVLDLYGPLGSIIPRSDYYKVTLASVNEDDKGVESSMKNGIFTSSKFTIDQIIESKNTFDTFLIPGGIGCRPLFTKQDVLEKIACLVDRSATVFTVCTGSVLLAATGKLDGRKATTNKRAFDQLTPNYSKVYWQKRARWVVDGKYITASGITAGIDAGYAFMAKTYIAPEDRTEDKQEISVEGEETKIPGFDSQKALKHAQSVAYRLEYRWHSDPSDDPFVDPQP